jgi:uncharacterized protein (TIGR03435 family)
VEARLGRHPLNVTSAVEAAGGLNQQEPGSHRMLRGFRETCLILLSSVAWAQDVASPPRFEVASVKPSGENDRIIGLFTFPGGRVTATRYTLKMFIHEAYDVEDYRILGGPNWVSADLFNLEAKPAASSPLSQWVPPGPKTPPTPEMRRMLQSLLADRFGLQVHRESKPDVVYTLKLAKGGPKLASPKDATAQPFVSFLPHALRGQNATLDLLVDRITTLVKRPVANQTGLKGNFDFLIDYPPDDAGSDTEVLLLRGLKEAGLELQSERGAVEVIVIDHAEKPSAN